MSRLFTDDPGEIQALHLLAEELGLEKALHFLHGAYYLLTEERRTRAIVELGAVDVEPKESDDGG
jgi:hypothetical protein